MIFKNFWLFLFCIFLNVRATDFRSVPSQIQRHDTISYTVHHDPLGNISCVEVWVDSIHVPLIDGIPCWQDMRGYKLHVWHNPEPNKSPPSQQHLPHQDTTFTSRKEPAPHDYQPPPKFDLPILGNNQMPTQPGMYGAIRTNTGISTSSQISNMSDAQFQDFWLTGLLLAKHSRARYQMNINQKNDLMSSCRYKTFTDKLLQHIARSEISDDAVWELFNQFVESKKLHGDGLYDSQKKIQNALQKRKELYEQREQDRLQGVAQQTEHQIRQNENKAILRRYQQALRSNEYTSPYNNQRDQAITQTIETNCQTKVQTHHFDAPTMAVLKSNGIDHTQFTSLAGTIFQHQLFQEVAQHYKNIATIVFDHAIKNSCIVPHILEFAQTAFDATKMKQLGFAMQLSDIAQLLAETSLSICKGTIESLCGLAEMVCHPKKTAQQLAQVLIPILTTMGGALAVYDHEPSICTTSMRAAHQAFERDIQTFNQFCDLSSRAFLNWYEQSSVQDKIQAASKLTADFVLQPFLLGKAGKACWGILSEARELQAMESLMCLPEELGFTDIVQDIVQCASKEEALTIVLVDLETPLCSLIDAEIVATTTPAGFIDVACQQTFLDNIRSLQACGAFYKNTPLQKQAIKYFDQFFYQKELLEFCAGVEKTHSVMMVEYAGKKVKMVCNPRHMMTYQLNFRTSSTLKQVDGYFGGGHIGLFYDELISQGFFKVVQDIPLDGGCRALELGHAFGNNTVKKTIWPKHWTAEKIMDELKHVWENQIFLAEDIIQNNPVWTVHGYSSCGLKVEMIVTFSNDILKVKTAYPYFYKFSRYS